MELMRDLQALACKALHDRVLLRAYPGCWGHAFVQGRLKLVVVLDAELN